jgi:5'-nucleotidase / UDP-sugar diphosphatase
MKKLLFFVCLCLADFVMAQDLIILHTNDMHSHFNGLAPETEYTPLINDNDPTQGGMSRIAGLIKSEKEEYGDKVLVVDAGDCLMGTLFQTLETETGFQLNLMKKMGYDFVTLGNHEFDFGPNTLATIIENNKKLGAIPQILSTNYLFAKDGSDSSLVKEFKDGTILPFSVIEKNGYKIGLFGLLGQDADDAIAGYINVSFNKINKVAKKTASYLKKVEKVDLVVVLSHSGVTKMKDGNWEGEDYKLARAVPDIDIVISGHTHTELPQLVHAGNGVVVQTGENGKKVGQIEVRFDKNRKPSVEYKLITMDDKIPGDPIIQKLIDEKSEYIDKNLLSDLGIQSNKPLYETGFELTMNDKKPEPSNLGPFISDAVYYMLNNHYHEKVDMTILATGIIRHNIDVGKTGKQNINDLFNIMPLGIGEGKIPGSPLGKIYITGNELKKVMELIFAVYHSKSDYYLYSTGMQIKYNPEKGLFKKISEITVGNDELGYRKVSFSKKDKTLYSLAANKYILSFIGALKKMSFGIVNVVGKNADGTVIKNDNFLIDLDKNKEGVQEAKEWLALLEYVRSFPDTNGNGLPDVPSIYKTKVNQFLMVK